MKNKLNKNKKITSSLKSLLEEFSIPITTKYIYDKLEANGLMETIEYISTSGSGEVKTYRQFTKLGETYGINEIKAHPFATQPIFYSSKFENMLKSIFLAFDIEYSETGITKIKILIKP